MPRRPLTALLALLLAAVPFLATSAAPALAQPTAVAATQTARSVSGEPAGVLAEGTRWATPYYVVDSGKAGPMVLVTGGVHGNEPAGAAAADQIRHWRPAKGRLLLIPRCNVPGLEADTRRMPGEPEAIADLNRNFPRSDEANAARGPAAEVLWAFIQKHRPDVTVDLHEGYGFRSAGSKSVGSSIIRIPHPETKRLQDAMLKAVNASDPEHAFARLHGGADGSLARACGERLGARAFICETTYKDQPLTRRVRQHRIMVHALLDALGMAASGPDTLLPPRRDGEPVRVALYAGTGTGPKTNVRRAIHAAENDRIVDIGEAGVRADVLRQFDVLLVPGGSGSKQASAMTSDGREAVRDFVRRGGGYVGVCAGAYLATSHYKWSLGVLDAAVLDTKHWKRGTGKVAVELTDAGRTLLRYDRERTDIYFANGPLLAPDGQADIPDFEPLAVFRGEVTEHGAPKGVMPGTVAVASGRFGEGRVIVFSPHPEKTNGLEGMLLTAVRWAAGQ